MRSFFNIDQVASVPLNTTSPTDMQVITVCGGEPPTVICGVDGKGLFVRRRAAFRLLEEGELERTVTRLHFRPQDHANTPFDAALIDRPEITSYLKVRHFFDAENNDVETWEITPEDLGRATLSVWGPGKDDIFNCGQLLMPFRIIAVRDQN